MTNTTPAPSAVCAIGQAAARSVARRAGQSSLRRGGVRKRLVSRDMDEIVRSVLEHTRTWAVVGCSPSPARDSHRIARMLQSRGYRVIPVNPACDELLGERCYARIEEASAEAGPIDVVDI